MWAIVTGASSGIGWETAKFLSSLGFDLVVVARREDRLLELKKRLKTNCLVVRADLTKKEDCFKLYEQTKELDIDVLVNNAGFGDYGVFIDNDLEKELSMIDVNIKGLHTLTKLYLRDFVEKDRGYILNVASSAGFMPGPYMATYYASKNYVVALTQAVREELRREKSNVYLGLLCPGPVNTEFNAVAEVQFSLPEFSPKDVARIGINGMFTRKGVIVPGMAMSLGVALSRLIPLSILVKLTAEIQTRKQSRR